MVERERGPTREPPQPVSIDMGPHTYNGGGPDAVADTKEELHRLGGRPHMRQKCSARAKEPYCRPNTRTRLRTRAQLPAAIASSS